MRPIGKFALNAVVFLCLFTRLASAQVSTQSIRGLVKDIDGRPVNAAFIILRNTKFNTETSEDGKFSLTVPAGEYQLVVSHAGFRSETIEVSLTAGKDVDLSQIKLNPGKELDEVLVVGRNRNARVREQAFNVNVVDTRKLYNTSADLNHALNQTSGVRVREDGGVGSNFTFSLNGFSGKQVKFFLDGIPMDNFGSSLTLNNFPVNMAERIDVYKGVTPVSLGADALGGAVNIITRSNPNYLDVSYGYGSFNTHKASVNHAYTHAKTGFTVRTNAFLNYSDNNYDVSVRPIDLNSGQRMATQEVERFHDGYQSIGAQVEAGITGKKYADKLLLGVIFSGNEKDVQTGVTMDQVFGARTTRSNAVIPTLKYKKTDLFVRGLDLGFYGAYNLSTNHFIDTTRLRYNWLKETIPTSSAELSRTQLKNRDNDGIVTANLAYTINENRSVSLNYVMTDFGRKSSDVEDLANPTYRYPQHLNKQVAGVAWEEKHARLTATAFAKLYALNAKSFEQVSNGTGVAEYRESSKQSTNLGYGVAGAYFVLPGLQAKASFEHTYRLPEAVELLGDGLYTRRNSALKPESSDNINVGALFALNFSEVHRLNFEANYIFRNSRDYIRLDQAQSQPIDRQFINIGDVQTNGVEGEIRYSWKNTFRASVNATYQSIIDKQKFLTSTNFQGTIITPNLGYGYRIPNTPYLFGNAELGYMIRKVGGEKNTLDITYSLNFTQKYYLTPYQLGANNQDIIPTQFAHNIAVNYSLGDGRYNISGECRNLANNDLFDNYLLQKPGRSFFVKLRYFISK
ncbi:MAG: TonB-dependent receptor [Chitinophagaceae bacterium]|nr:MAG: TonB-dependent receptor [Chitinophagaceae bacterium]